MKKRIFSLNQKAFLFLFFALFLGLLISLTYKKNALKSLTEPAPPSLFSENDKFIVYSQKVLNLPKEHFPMELFQVGNDFLVATWNNNNPSPIYFIRSLGEDLYRDETSAVFDGETISSIHPRDAIAFDLSGDKQLDFIVADQGMDQPPYPGSYPIYLRSEKDNWSQAEKTALSDRPLFTYHLSAMSYKNKKYLYLSNLNSQGTAPMLWEIDAEGRFQNKSEFIPKNIREGKDCYMASLMADFDADGIDELVLGACDRGNIESSLPRDLMLKFDEKAGFIPLESSSLPLRKKAATWGTAHFVAADFDQDGRKDILALPHNPGFSESALQIYYQKEKLRFITPSIPFPYVAAKNSFVIWATVGDINGDHFPDIAFAVRHKDYESGKNQPKFKLYLNQMGKKFVDATPILPMKDLDLMGMHFLPANNSEPQNLFAMDYNGNYYLVKIMQTINR